ncbi:hypothetical protein [Deinococcus cavernae]|nr:hypothetical protein [Deinococcus cavernae]
MFSPEPTDALTKDIGDILNVRSPAYRRLFGSLLGRLAGKPQ